MSWLVSVQSGESLRLYERGEVVAAVTMALMATGTPVDEARKLALGSTEVAGHWTMPLPDLRSLTVSPGEPPEDPNAWCPDYDSFGDHCGKHLHHKGKCDSGRH